MDAGPSRKSIKRGIAQSLGLGCPSRSVGTAPASPDWTVHLPGGALLGIYLMLRTAVRERSPVSVHPRLPPASLPRGTLANSRGDLDPVRARERLALLVQGQACCPGARIESGLTPNGRNAHRAPSGLSLPPEWLALPLRRSVGPASGRVRFVASAVAVRTPPNIQYDGFGSRLRRAMSRHSEVVCAPLSQMRYTTLPHARTTVGCPVILPSLPEPFCKQKSRLRTIVHVQDNINSIVRRTFCRVVVSRR